jgi:cytochrome c biogenesis protein CcmG/thiol:disulfide interchange protein DsbE
MIHIPSSPRRPFAAPFLIAFALLAAGCASTTAAEPGDPAAPASGKGARIGAKLPAFEVKDFEGKAVDRGAWQGKVLLLDVWASWCGPCKEELPLLDAMAARLGKKGIVVLAVSIDEDRADAVRFLDGHGRPWSLSLAHDADARIAARLAPPKMPTSYIVDRTGTIRYINEGFQRGDSDVIESRLLALAAKEP